MPRARKKARTNGARAAKQIMPTDAQITKANTTNPVPKPRVFEPFRDFLHPKALQHTLHIMEKHGTEHLPAKIGNLKEMAVSATTATMAKRVAPYLRKLFPTVGGDHVEIMSTILFPKAPPLPSQVTVFKMIRLFEVYLLLLQQQEEPAPIGMTVEEYKELTHVPTTTPPAIPETTEPIAISDSPQTIEDIIGNASENDSQRLHGDATTQVQAPTRQQLITQESADNEVEIAALKTRIAELQQDAARHAELTRIHGMAPDITHCRDSRVQQAIAGSHGLLPSQKTGTICPPKLYAAIRKLDDLQLDVVLAWITRTTCTDTYSYQIGADGVPVATSKTTTRMQITTENQLCRIQNSIITGITKLNPKLGSDLATTWPMSFLQVQSMRPGNIQLQREYLQRQTDSMLDSMRDGTAVNMSLDTALLVHLDPIFTTDIGPPPPHPHHSQRQLGQKRPFSQHHAHRPPPPRPFLGTPTQALRDTPCRNTMNGKPCAYQPCPFRHNNPNQAA
eukprot:m.420091 g.420091  ORF g.420091 m.420091 type:complete len:506 (-) comp21313_c0_seq4:266-1783(-)